MTDSYYMRRTNLVDAAARRAPMAERMFRNIWEARAHSSEQGYPNGAYLYTQQRLLAAAVTQVYTHQTPM